MYLFRFKDAWSFAVAADSKDGWEELAEAALEHLDISVGTYLRVMVSDKQ